LPKDIQLYFAKGHTTLAVFSQSKFLSKLPSKVTEVVSGRIFSGSFKENFASVKTAKAVCHLAMFVSKTVCNYAP
jgi:hypothetical protein